MVVTVVTDWCVVCYCDDVMMTSSCCHTDFYPPVGPPVTSPFLYSSYGEQHNDEVLKIFGLIQDMKVPILMGDFNHGPGSPGQARGGGGGGGPINYVVTLTGYT